VREGAGAGVVGRYIASYTETWVFSLDLIEAKEESRMIRLLHNIEH